MPARPVGYPVDVTEQDGRNGPDPGQDAPLDPESAVDELEKRVASRRAGDDAADRADDTTNGSRPAEDDEGTTPVEGDSGTGVDEESPG